MSDDEIREILRERKRREREQERIRKREDIEEAIGDVFGWACLFGLGYMMFVFGQIFA